MHRLILKAKLVAAMTLAILSLALASTESNAYDWPRFRGKSGSGVATDSDSLPSKWSPTANLDWKTALPGPGASSPIIVGNKIFVTCYSGYGVTKERAANKIENLVRHLVCIDLKTGNKIWQADIKASLPEDSYYESGVSSHGYASHTPATDGTNVYCFFGKGGVYAFDLNGNELWNASAGKESDPPKWGSSSSPVIYKDTVIVTASAESQSIIGLDKNSGKELWRQAASGLDGMWGTPSLIRVNEDRTDLVMLVAGEIWGLDPDSGKLRWFSTVSSSQQAYTSIVSKENRVFAFAGQGGGSLAVDAGGLGDVTATNRVWSGRVYAVYGSPVLQHSRLYVVSRGILSVVDAETGARLEQTRLKGARKFGNARFGSLDYASPVIAGDRLFYPNASGQMFVFEISDGLKLIAVNEVSDTQEVFWGSPAVSNGRMVIRSSKHIYCIRDKGETVEAKPSGNAQTPSTAANETSESKSSEPSASSSRRKGWSRKQREESKSEIKRPDRPQRPEWAK